MAELLCEVNFHYSNEDIPELHKRVIEKYFMNGRGAIVELLNPHYDEWNEAYGEVVDQDDYNNYIRNKQQEVIDKYNRLYGNAMKFYSNEECDIAAKFVYGKQEVTMYMTIKLLNEEEWKASI
jgi:hypothetical protein